MEEEIDLEAVQLKVLTAKKQQLFASIQRIFDVSKNVGSESSRATFLKKVGTVEVLFKEFVTTLEKCCSLELRINPGAKISFSEMATVEEMVGYIKYKDGELAKPPPPAPTPAPAPISPISSLSTSGLNFLQENLTKASSSIKFWRDKMINL
ncbi:hypothetical protein M8J76_007068 [Diaphorina citri]|nr:hypothetical protein M8J76_007068 [Diaphorina citri]